MNRHLDRLLNAAARASAPLPEGAPSSVQSRLLARGWARHETLDEWLAILPVVRRALVWACVVALAAVAIGYLQLDTPSSDEAILLNSALALDTLP